MLRHYHDQLLQRGVSGYEWRQFFNDYRLCVRCVTVAVEYVRGGHTRWHDFVLNLLQNTLSAMESLDCAVLCCGDGGCQDAACTLVTTRIIPRHP